MKPAPFTYQRPLSRAAALEALAQASPPRILAGGQSLVPMLNLRIAAAEAILDISRIPELREVQELNGGIRYGALTTHAAFEDRAVPDCSNGLMPFVGGRIAYRAIRTRGTIGGALALADPAADWLAAVIALAGVVHVASLSGRRTIAAEEFVLGPYSTALRDDELLEAVEIPRRPPSERWGYHKVTAKVGDYASSMAIVLLDRERGFARAVLSGTVGAPLLLQATARAMLQGLAGEPLGALVREELAASGRGFSPAQLILHTTTILRAAQAAAAR